jgi:hypothetical protein
VSLININFDVKVWDLPAAIVVERGEIIGGGARKPKRGDHMDDHANLILNAYRS